MKKQDMLKKNKEFRHVVSKGVSCSSPYMVLICAKRHTGIKAGFSVSAKLGNAVVRNRTKRIMRAALTALWPQLQDSASYLFIARRALIGQTSLIAQREMVSLLKKAGKIHETVE